MVRFLIFLGAIIQAGLSNMPTLGAEPAPKKAIEASNEKKIMLSNELKPIEKSGPVVMEILDPGSYASRGLQFSRDGKFLLAINNKLVLLWNIETKKVERQLTNPCRVGAACFLGKKDILLAGCEDGNIRVWDYR